MADLPGHDSLHSELSEHFGDLDSTSRDFSSERYFFFLVSSRI
jgi:hypothetical protein